MLALLALAELLGMSLWFSGSAVGPLLQARWGIEVSLQTVFDTESLAGLADHIVESELADVDDDLLASLLGEMGEGEL